MCTGLFCILADLKIEQLTLFKSLDVTLEPLLHVFPGFLAHKFLAKRTERSQEERQQLLTEVFCLRFHTCPVVTLKAAGLLVSWAFTV